MEKKIENKIELKQNKGHINKINLGLTISSIKLMKKIFSHINIKKQLKLMKYSKAIQTKNCINIEDYKKFSGRYIIKGKNDQVKIFSLYTNILLYKGKYLNDKKNGKGKEYDEDGQLIFSGEYLNGERIGKGKEYDGKGQLIYDGEFLNGERNGKGKEYNSKGQLIFEGEYLNGKKWNGRGYNKYGELILEKYFKY